LQFLIMQYSAGSNCVHIISSALGVEVFAVYVSPQSFKCKTDVVKWNWRKLHKNKFQFVPSSSFRRALLIFKYISTKLRRRCHAQFTYVTMSWGRARSHQLMLVLESRAATRWETQQKYCTHRSTCFK
jgi:hypothetical protein